jgi:hypothetical protein
MNTRSFVAVLGVVLLQAHTRAEDKPSASAPAVDVIALARQVTAQRFDGFTYGPDQSRKQIDCVQFTGAVVEALLGRKLTREETDALYIRYPFDDLNAAVESGEARTKGIQRALVEFIKRGAVVETSKVKAGDFVQYWIKARDGKWAGHSAIVTKVFTDSEGAAGIAIYSSNRSTNGIAEMDFGGKGLTLRGTDRRFYFVRFAAAVPAVVPAGPQPEFEVALPGVSELSGLTWRRGEQYYAVSDSQPGLLPLQIRMDPASGLVTGVKSEPMVKVTTTFTDFEDIAWVESGSRFIVSTERPPGLLEITLQGGCKISPVLPAVYQQARLNKGMEALTRDPDNGHLWTANEDTLTPDGAVSSHKGGALVRLQEFDEVGRPLRQFAWRSETPLVQGGTGITGLCALPGGGLIVMERIVAGAWLEVRLFLAGFEGATDTSRMQALSGVNLTPVHKTPLYQRLTGFTNYEGICAGPLLADGSRSLLLVADNGSGTVHKFLALRITR